MSYTKRWYEDIYYEQILKGIPFEEIARMNNLDIDDVEWIRKMFEEEA